MGTRKPHGLHLPLCPYCEGRFLYGDVRRHITDKTGVCPNCGKRFSIRAKGRIILLWCIAGVLLCLMNLIFWSLEQVNVLFISGFTAVTLCCLFPLHPFVVRYRRLQEQTEKPKDLLPAGRRRSRIGKKGRKTG